jgi:hypothetical protein
MNLKSGHLEYARRRFNIKTNSCNREHDIEKRIRTKNGATGSRRGNVDGGIKDMSHARLDLDTPRICPYRCVSNFCDGSLVVHDTYPSMVIENSVI